MTQTTSQKIQKPTWPECYTALIVDDEPLARKRLRRQLDRVKWLEVVGEAEDGISAVASANALRPDVLFLDIRMPGRSGLGVVREIDYEPAVVFTTAHERYAVNAFDVQAVDFLLKPFAARRFAQTIDRLRASLDRSKSLDGSPRDEPGDGAEILLVRQGGRIVPVALADVGRIEARDDYVVLHTESGRFLVGIRMYELEERLDPHRFVRIHRSHFVNLDFLERFDRHESGRLVALMTDGTELFVSRSRSKELRRLAR